MSTDLHTLGSTSQEEPCNTDMPSGLCQVRFFGLTFGHSWGVGEGQAWHLVRYLCELRKALHERHAWKTLTKLECKLFVLNLTIRGPQMGGQIRRG